MQQDDIPVEIQHAREDAPSRAVHANRMHGYLSLDPLQFNKNREPTGSVRGKSSLLDIAPPDRHA
jgi:hypothetical protein